MFEMIMLKLGGGVPPSRNTQQLHTTYPEHEFRAFNVHKCIYNEK
jgi:hypothetical protein